MRLSDLSVLLGLARMQSSWNWINLEWRAKSNRILQSFFFRAAEELQIQLLVEIGAHWAEASTKFVASGKSAIAYEANPYTYSSKTLLAKSEKLQVFNLGIGRAAGVSTMHIPIRSTGDARLTPGDAGFRPKSNALQSESLEVNIATLDEEVKRLRINSPLALWIDAEGLAYEVLAGGRHLLESGLVKLIIVEVENIPYFKSQELSSSVDELLHGIGYIPIARDGEYENQFNVVYCNKEDFPSIDELVQVFWTRMRGLKPFTLAAVKIIRDFLVKTNLINLIN